MSLLGPAWTTYAGSVALAIALAGATGFYQGSKHEKANEAVRLAQQGADARAKEQATAKTTFRLQEVRDGEDIRINDRLADALQRLRNHPAERMSPAATPASAGATGRELSGPDAGFLERLAARGDRLRADLETCRGWIETVTGKVSQPN
jgi:hypothetical protein